MQNTCTQFKPLSTPAGITTQACQWGLPTCTSASREFETTPSYGELCMTREPAGTGSPCSWDASPGPSRLPWLKSASASLMVCLPWTMSPSRTVRCPRRWRSAPRTHISTVCVPGHVWTTCRCVTLWMTAGMDRMKRDVVSTLLEINVNNEINKSTIRTLL